VVLEQSPAARSNTAPSYPPSEFSSWHDDASSSLATCSAGDLRVTVNTQRARMGEHLRGKLEGMIRQRFEDYLRIITTLQNDIGKLAALECQLRTSPGGEVASARASISCNEDGTFLVYTVPDVSSALAGSARGPSCASSASSLGDGVRLPASSSMHSPCPNVIDSTVSSTDVIGSSVHGPSLPCDGVELLRRWVQQVCEFGMSGRCHSLTALFHFGYNVWKQTLRETTSEHIAEEEERPREAIAAPQARAELHAASHLRHEELKWQERPPDAVALLKAARTAVEREHFQKAVEICGEGLALARAPTFRPGWRLSADASAAAQTTSVGRGVSPSGSSSSAAVASPGGGAANDPGDREGNIVVWQLLTLRADLQVRLLCFDAALQDAEELIALQPTCAEGYYWQFAALQGMGHRQEAVEALMSALEYEPQNALFQQALTSLFEEMSDGSAGCSASRSRVPHQGVTMPGTAAADGPDVLHRRPRGGPGDALSTTTQATHLSSRSTTPTEVSEPLSRSSSNDSVYAGGAAFEDAT